MLTAHLINQSGTCHHLINKLSYRGNYRKTFQASAFILKDWIDLFFGWPHMNASSTNEPANVHVGIKKKLKCDWREVNV